MIIFIFLVSLVLSNILRPLTKDNVDNETKEKI